VFPCLVLVCLGVPSLWLLLRWDFELSCTLEAQEACVSAITGNYYYLPLTVIGHQWYWDYDVCIRWLRESVLGFHDDFSSYGVINSIYWARDVDVRLFLPLDLCPVVSATSADVLHSFAMPA